jgi:riboflavin kinase/FMN adenylyltransferase
MKVFQKLDQIPRDFGPTVLTVGNYDGLHLGHRQILRQIVERAKHLQARSVVLTFDPHPIRILRPREAPPLITPMPYKLRLLEETGLDAVVILPFTRDLSTMPPFEFAEQILSSALDAVEVHEGFNFRFGHRAEGDLDRLREYGTRLGFTVRAYEALQVRGYLASSSQVRPRAICWDALSASTPLQDADAATGTSTPCPRSISAATTSWFPSTGFTSPRLRSPANASMP